MKKILLVVVLSFLLPNLVFSQFPGKDYFNPSEQFFDKLDTELVVKYKIKSFSISWLKQGDKKAVTTETRMYDASGKRTLLQTFDDLGRIEKTVRRSAVPEGSIEVDSNKRYVEKVWYLPDGRHLKTQIFSSSGNPLSESKSEYDNSKNCIFTYFVFRNNIKKLDLSLISKYNDKYQLTEETKTDSSGKLMEKDIYKYNSDGLVLTQEHKDSEHKLYNFYRYEYNKDNQKIKEIFIYHDETKTDSNKSVTIYSYDKKNRLIREGDDVKSKSGRHYSYDKSGNLIKSVYDFGSGAGGFANTKYDKENRPVEFEFSNEGGAGHYTYKYDDKGLLIELAYSENSIAKLPLPNVTKFEYTFW